MQGIELTPEIPIAELTALAERAETEGFDTIFSSYHYNNRSPFITLDRIAAATETVQVGPGVANPYDVHPVTLASHLATLQEVSDGRAIFGIGAGDQSTLTNLGITRHRPLRRVLETMDVARRLWQGDRVTHTGTFDAQDAGLNYSVSGTIPVYVGAQGPDMLRMAGKHADGVLINAAHPRDVEWATDRVREGVSDRVRPDDVDIAVYASVSIAPDAAAAREAARPPVAFIAAGAKPPVLDRHDIDPELASHLGDLIAQGAFREAFATVSDPMIDAFCVTGTPGTVSDRLAEFTAHADSIVAGAPLGPDQATAVSLLADAFAPPSLP